MLEFQKAPKLRVNLMLLFMICPVISELVATR